MRRYNPRVVPLSKHTEISPIYQNEKQDAYVSKTSDGGGSGGIVLYLKLVRVFLNLDEATSRKNKAVSMCNKMANHLIGCLPPRRSGGPANVQYRM